MNADGLRRVPIPLALALVAASTAVGTMLDRSFEDYLRFLVRETAYVSSSFFLLAYFARPLRQLTSSDWAAALVRVRRQIGIAAALAHTVHFGAVVALVRFSGTTVDAVTLVGGGLGFVVFWLMALTSNETSVRALGPNWKRVHRFGIHYLWFIFFITYLGDVARAPYAYGTYVALLGSGLLLRMYLTFERRRA